MMKVNLNDTRTVESICIDGAPEKRKPYVQGMAALSVSHHGSLGPAKRSCARLGSFNRPACYDIVEAHSGLFTDLPT